MVDTQMAKIGIRLSASNKQNRLTGDICHRQGSPHFVILHWHQHFGRTTCDSSAERQRAKRIEDEGRWIMLRTSLEREKRERKMEGER